MVGRNNGELWRHLSGADEKMVLCAFPRSHEPMSLGVKSSTESFTLLLFCSPDKNISYFRIYGPSSSSLQLLQVGSPRSVSFLLSLQKSGFRILNPTPLSEYINPLYALPVSCFPDRYFKQLWLNFAPYPKKKETFINKKG